MKPLRIAGAWLYTPEVHEDTRGALCEVYRADVVEEHLGCPFRVAQATCVTSGRGVIRGIHYADVPPGQAKYATCVRGRVLDVVVDIRTGSPSFGGWEAVPLDDQDCHAVYLAEGLGHALMALSEQATVVYFSSVPHDPGREHAIHPLDPQIGVAWPEGVPPVLSARDRAAPSLEWCAAAGMLPAYGEA